MLITGDIVYFKSTHIAIYTMQNGSYKYYFKPGDKYQITSIKTGTNTDSDYISGSIINLEDNTKHFMHSSIYEKLISKEEFIANNREKTLNELGI